MANSPVPLALSSLKIDQQGQQVGSEGMRLVHCNELEAGQLIRVRVRDLLENPDSPRHYTEVNRAENITKSMREHGQERPITVSLCKVEKNPHMVVVDGHMRLAAAQDIGLPDLLGIYAPALSSQELYTTAVQRNVLSDYGYMERVLIFERLIGYARKVNKIDPMAEVSRLLAVKSATIKNDLRFLRAPVELRDLMLRNAIGRSTVLAILTVMNLQNGQFDADALREIFSEKLRMSGALKIGPYTPDQITEMLGGGESQSARYSADVLDERIKELQSQMGDDVKVRILSTDPRATIVADQNGRENSVEAMVGERVVVIREDDERYPPLAQRAHPRKNEVVCIIMHNGVQRIIKVHKENLRLDDALPEPKEPQPGSFESILMARVRARAALEDKREEAHERREERRRQRQS